METSTQSLADLVHLHRVGLLEAWRAEVRKMPIASKLDVPTLNDHLADLILELVQKLREGGSETLVESIDQDHLGQNPVYHGLQRLELGFDLEEVVAEYNALRSTILNLAEEHQLSVDLSGLHILNRVIDGAIGVALKSYAFRMHRQALEKREENLAFLIHDIRSPLAVVTTATQLLESRQGRDDPTSSELIEVILRNASKLDGMIVTVLHQAEPSVSQLEKRTFALFPVVSGLLRDLAPLAQTAHTELVNKVDPELQVTAESHRLMLILQNLVGNALRHAPGGTLEVGAICHPDGSCQIWVQDEGPGVPPEQRQKIFSKFEKLVGSDAGFGLGLAIVRELVVAHGGEVEVLDASGGGSRFQFSLPGPV